MGSTFRYVTFPFSSLSPSILLSLMLHDLPLSLSPSYIRTREFFSPSCLDSLWCTRGSCGLCRFSTIRLYPRPFYTERERDGKEKKKAPKAENKKKASFSSAASIHTNIESQHQRIGSGMSVHQQHTSPRPRAHPLILHRISRVFYTSPTLPPSTRCVCHPAQFSAPSSPSFLSPSFPFYPALLRVFPRVAPYFSCFAAASASTFIPRGRSGVGNSSSSSSSSERR